MLNTIHPKLPMRNKAITKQFYTEILGFKTNGQDDYNHYLILSKDNIEIHFFLYESLIPENNYGQVYIRINNINNLYKTLVDSNVAIHPNGKLESKPWGQKEFSLLDPDLNLLTFGQSQ